MRLRVERKTSKSMLFAAVVPQESASGPGKTTRKSLTVDLASGGTVEISMDVDLLRLDKPDREFVLDLIDKIHAYRDDRQRAKKRDAELDNNQPVTFHGDQEAPF